MSTSGNIIEATVNVDGTATVIIDDQTHDFAAANEDEARAKTLALVVAHATSQEAPVRARMTDEQGTWPVKVHPDGTVDPDTENSSRVVQEEAAEPTPAPKRKRKSTPAESAPAPEAEPQSTSAKPVRKATTAPKTPALETIGSPAPSPTTKAANPFTQKAPTATKTGTRDEQQLPPASTRREARQSFLTKEQATPKCPSRSPAVALPVS